MLIQRADSACGLAREAKGERIYVHRAPLAVKRDQEASLTDARMLDQVREIIEHEWVWLVFQPMASMRGDTNERYEALLRLRDNQGQEIVPGSVFGVVYNHELGLNAGSLGDRARHGMLKQRQQATTLFIKVLPVTLQDKTLSGWLRSGWSKAASRRSASCSRSPNRPPNAACATCSPF
jgi:hypothetical protein